ncbi:MAG: DUF4150 domain-containing protein [Sandaracinaceae bacterium]
MTVFFNKRSAIWKTDLDSVGPVDVCKVPTPGGPPVPTPFVNLASGRDLAKGTRRVLIRGQSIGVKDALLSKSTGDQPGSLGGVLSNKIMGSTKWLSCSSDVVLEGRGALRFLDTAMMNGNAGNGPSVPEGAVFFQLRYDFMGDVACLNCGEPLKDHDAKNDFAQVDLVEPKPEDGMTDAKCYARLDVGGRTFSAVSTSGQGSGLESSDLVNPFSRKPVLATKLDERLQPYKNGHPTKGFTGGANCCAERSALYLAQRGGALEVKKGKLPAMTLMVCFPGGKTGGFDLSMSKYAPREYEGNPTLGNYGPPCAHCQLGIASALCKKAVPCEECMTRLQRMRDVEALASRYPDGNGPGGPIFRLMNGGVGALRASGMRNESLAILGIRSLGRGEHAADLRRFTGPLKEYERLWRIRENNLKKIEACACLPQDVKPDLRQKATFNAPKHFLDLARS